MGNIEVNKIEAARRQIDVAIRLLFNNEDPVAIHTLAMAAFKILKDLAKVHGNVFIHKTTQAVIRPGKESDFWGKMHSFSNFLKHADKDPDGIVDNIKEEVNDLGLMLCARYYQDLGSQLTPEMTVLNGWCVALNPHLLSEGVPSSVQELLLTIRRDLVGKTRPEQLAVGKELLEEIREIATLRFN